MRLYNLYLSPMGHYFYTDIHHHCFRVNHACIGPWNKLLNSVNIDLDFVEICCIFVP